MKTFLIAMAIIWFTPLAIMLAAGIACSVSKAARRLCREFLIGLPPEPLAMPVKVEKIDYPAIAAPVTDLAA